MVSNQVWVSHHGHALFPLPNPSKTIAINEASWNYDNDIDAKGDDEDDNTGVPPQGGNAMGATYGDVVPPPTPHSWRSP